MIKNFLKENSFVAHFPIEVRWVKSDDIWLSPSYQKDVCYIGVVVYKPYEKEYAYKELFESFDKLMLSLDGRPHWAKLHSLNKAQLEKIYPKFENFLQVRDKLDPNRMFSNKTIEKFLGK